MAEIEDNCNDTSNTQKRRDLKKNVVINLFCNQICSEKLCSFIAISLQLNTLQWLMIKSVRKTGLKPAQGIHQCALMII